MRLLEELGAIPTDEQASAYKLTPLGRQLCAVACQSTSGAYGAGSAKTWLRA
ncbi:hypothetical protein ACLK19_09580 [Escherichia coli]